MGMEKIKNFIDQNNAKKEQIKNIDKQVVDINKKIEQKERELEISQNAIEILRSVSDKAIKGSYDFLENTINETLARVFVDNRKQIRIVESSMGGQYPQVDLELISGNGIVRSIGRDGHGVEQVISLLSTLCLIIITGSRRFVAMDEVLSGVSNETLKVVDDIMHDFADLGFSFLINEHGFMPKGAKVYEIEMIGDKSLIKDEYIEENGVYRNNEKV